MRQHSSINPTHDIILHLQSFITVMASSVRCSHFTIPEAILWPLGLLQFDNRLTMLLCVAFSPTWGATGCLPQIEFWAVVAGGVVVTGNSHQPAHPVVPAAVCWISTCTKLYFRLFTSSTPCATSLSRPYATPQLHHLLLSGDAAEDENPQQHADALLFLTRHSVRMRQTSVAQSTGDYWVCS